MSKLTRCCTDLNLIGPKTPYRANFLFLVTGILILILTGFIVKGSNEFIIARYIKDLAI